MTDECAWEPSDPSRIGFRAGSAAAPAARSAADVSREYGWLLHAPAALAIHDFSQAQLYLAQLRANGVQNPCEYVAIRHGAALELGRRAVLVVANAECLRLFDVDTPEELHARWLAEITDAKASRIWEALAASPGATAHIELACTIRDRRGTPRVVAQRCAVNSPAAALTGLVCSAFWDDTVRRQTEAAAQQCEAELRAVLECVPTGLAVLDETGHIVRANPAAQELLGQAHVPNANAPVAVPGDAQQPESVLQLDIPWETPTREAERTVARADGRQVVCSISSAPVRLPNRAPFGMAISLTDVTARQSSEESHARLALAVEQSAEAVVITDAQGLIQYVNPAFTRISGYARQEVLGRNPRLLKSGDQDASFYRGMWETITRGGVWKGHFTNRRKDGTRYQEEAVISPVHDSAGRLTNFVAVKRDVTQELELAAQLRHAQKLEAVGQIAAGVAHDINNLLTAILGYADLACESVTADHPARGALGGIERVVQQAIGVTRSLLTFSGRSAALKSAVDVRAMVQEAARLLRRVLPAMIELHVKQDSQSPLWLTGDATQLQQVLMNLAVNARDAMPEGGQLHIDVRAVATVPQPHVAPDSAPGGQIVLEVRDTGVGMAPDVQARIFEPFFTTKPRERGTGLGLAIVDSIVRDHGGRLEVESAPGCGARFRIVLPAAAPTDLPPAAAVTAPPRGKGELVLLAEDDEFVNDVVAQALGAHGFRVERARDGAALWAQYVRHAAALRLLIIDQDLPVRRGLDCLAQIRRSGHLVPVIVISGDAGLDLGQVDPDTLLLRKPFATAELIRSVAEMLARAAADPARP